MLALIAGLLLGVIVHEAGHFTAARAFGYRPRLVLNKVKLATRLNVSHVPAGQDATMAAAGPAASIMLAAAFWFAGMHALALVNVELGALSLIPIRPQDGYWIFAALRRL